MFKSMIVSSIAISTSLCSKAHFEYPEDTIEDSWAAPTVLPAGEPNYCGNAHKYQSPINIQTSSLSTCPSSNTLSWDLKNTIHKFTVENTGHNLKMAPVCCGVVDNSDSGEPGDGESTDSDDSNDNPEFENLQSGTNFGVLTDIFGNKYCLDSFHIHWGQTNTEGSEHRINGEQSVMEMHFVHRDCDYASVTKAIEIPISNDATADPTLAVVAVMFQIDNAKPNPFIQKIVDQVTGLKDAHSEIEIASTDLEMSEVVPNPLGDYYYYKGSLTTPPCTPVVSWHVLGTKMTVSELQLKALRETIMDSESTEASPSYAAPNFRGAKVNGHTVHKCSESKLINNGDSDESD